MSVNPLLLPVKKNSETIKNTVLTNIVKMYCNRGWIKPEHLDSEIKKLINTQNDNHIYKINLDVDLKRVDTYYPVDEGEVRKISDDFIGTAVMVKLLPQKVTSVSKSPIIQEFLTESKKYHKILIVDSISDRAKTQASAEKHIEVFVESFFMLDLMELVCSPKYQVLHPKEIEVFLESYHLTRKQMKKMYDTDPASLYYFLKKKQIVRIIRDSEQTGSAVDYRLVIHK